MKKHVVLVYVPNQFCNFGCKYCYLGKLTDNKDKYSDITSKLQESVRLVEKDDYKIARFQLHGAEISTVPKKYLKELFEYMRAKLNENALERKIATDNHRTAPIHIKTNLSNFARLQDIYEANEVSVSGSFDLPFSLHAKYRVDKKGNSTLDETLENIKLLKDYKGGKGLSCVITKAHLEKFDEVVRDLKYMHEVIGFNMIENFYFMFGYDSKASEDKFQEKIDGTQMLSGDEMVEFYERIKKEFTGTQYEQAIKYGWFKEFQSGYCTDTKNCGTNQFLLQKNGDMYPCHRTQPDKEYKYGNIYEDGFANIVTNAEKVVQENEQKLTFADECMSCEYFKYCQQGCSLVRKEIGSSRSYTCDLQRALYKDNPLRYPKSDKKEIQHFVREFVLDNKPQKIKRFTEVYPKREEHIITQELYLDENRLDNIIKRDKDLSLMYESGMFKLIVNGIETSLEPQEYSYGVVYGIKDTDKIELSIDKRYFLINCPEDSVSGNSLRISMLRNTHTSYGEEKRVKQEHIWDEDVYYNQVVGSDSMEDKNRLIMDISHILRRHNDGYIDGVWNSVFFTTKQARIYHYEKHAKNAFYHIQAINIPFHNVKFIYKRTEK